MKNKLIALVALVLTLTFQPFCLADSNSDSAIMEQRYLQDVWKPSEKNFSALKIYAHMRSGNQKLNDNIEVGSLEWKDGKWQLSFQIGVWGVSDFARVKTAEWMSALEWQKQVGEPNLIKESYFKKTFENLAAKDLKQSLPKSFEDIPELAELIRKQIFQIEGMFNTDFIKTKIQVHFINERELIDANLWLSPQNITPKISEKLFSQELTSQNRFLPLKYSPIPNRDVIVPGAGDPYTWAQLMAHEIFHLISRIHWNDGFTFSNYPIEGIMNGGEQHKHLRSIGGEPKLLALELNTLIASQIAFGNLKVSNAPTDLMEIAKNLEKPSYTTEAILTDNLKLYSDEKKEIQQQIDRYKMRKKNYSN